MHFVPPRVFHFTIIIVYSAQLFGKHILSFISLLSGSSPLELSHQSMKITSQMVFVLFPKDSIGPMITYISNGLNRNGPIFILCFNLMVQTQRLPHYIGVRKPFNINIFFACILFADVSYVGLVFLECYPGRESQVSTSRFE